MRLPQFGNILSNCFTKLDDPLTKIKTKTINVFVDLR